jgi:hypothetical protein
MGYEGSTFQVASVVSPVLEISNNQQHKKDFGYKYMFSCSFDLCFAPQPWGWMAAQVVVPGIR